MFRKPHVYALDLPGIEDRAVLTIEGRTDDIRRAYEALSEGRAVVVDRARFARVREFADAAIAWDRAKTAAFRIEETIEEAERVRRAFAALQPGDLDPLP